MADIPDPIRTQCEEKGGLEGIIARLPEARDLKQKGKIFSALGDPMRLRILMALEVQPLCACLIREIIGISDSKLSYHLTVLKKAKLIEGKKQAQWIIYNLTDLGKKIIIDIQKY